MVYAVLRIYAVLDSFDMATVSNQSKTFISNTWTEATYTWGNAGSRTWENQTVTTNQAKNSATLTNQAKS